MKKLLCALMISLLTLASLSGCGAAKQNTAALKAYEATMTAFFNDLERINNDINDIDPNSQNAITELYASFDEFEKKYEEMSKVDVPSDLVYYESIKALAAEGSDYMSQANEYLHQAYSENDYNENVLEAAMECYRRANKRIQYIISLIHGVDPTATGK